MTRKEAIYYFEKSIAHISKRIGTDKENIKIVDNRVFNNDKDRIKSYQWAIKFIQESIDNDQCNYDNSREDMKTKLLGWREAARLKKPISHVVVHRLLNYIEDLENEISNLKS